MHDALVLKMLRSCRGVKERHCGSRALSPMSARFQAFQYAPKVSLIDQLEIERSERSANTESGLSVRCGSESSIEPV